MTKPAIPQSQKRYSESIGALFAPIESNKTITTLWLKSSTDQGVIRNGGRNGARFAPNSLLATFKKLTQTKNFDHEVFSAIEVGDSGLEEKDFSLAQAEETQKIKALLKTHENARICHIGGGHDHIFPLLSALSGRFKKIVVLNLDAHADTRTDETFHSGTPFRQFADNYSGTFHLFQIGLHAFANSYSTLTPLKKGSMSILWKKDLNSEKLSSMFEEIKKLSDDETAVVFSLDADALEGHHVPGVSAVNADGLSMEELKRLWTGYSELKLSHRPILGIYELNPVYDTLSGISMRSMSAFLFETF